VEVFWSLVVYCRSPHEGLPCWASVFIKLLGRSWAVEVAQEQVDRDTPVSSTPTTENKIGGGVLSQLTLSQKRQ
jgi:hypothetical protein